jgi:hypothetical protein
MFMGCRSVSKVQISERDARLSSLVVENEPNACELHEIVLCAVRCGLPCDPPVGIMPMQWQNDNGTLGLEPA